MTGIRWFTPEEVAAVLGLSPAAVRALIHSGELESRRVGVSGYYVPEYGLEEYIARQLPESLAVTS